jgi:hypothetical protein
MVVRPVDIETVGELDLAVECEAVRNVHLFTIAGVLLPHRLVCKEP